MKVDLVVNTMIQQIDRNLQSQVLPAVSYRAGELLRGKVMLTAGDRLQIRLDNGALLNAIPTGDVLLSPGATVTLRVSGQMDGQLVMQLLDQELTGERPAAASGDAKALLARMGLEQSPQGRAVAQAMEQMRFPLREETVRQALETMARFPGLEADKAVFLAVNRITATVASVDALNLLVNSRAMTGEELTRLMELLAPNGDGQERAAPARSTGVRAQAAATQPQADASVAAQPGGQAVGTAQSMIVIPSAPTGATQPAEPEGGQAAGSAPAGEQAVPSQLGAASASGSLDHTSVNTSQPTSGGSAAGSPAEAMLQLQSLIHVALGMGAVDQYSGVLVLLDRYGLAKQAVALALDGPLLSPDGLADRMEAFAASLPREAAAEARLLLEKLTAGLGKYMAGNEAASLQAQTADSTGIGRVVREINRLFARLDGGDGADALMQAASAQKAKVAQILSDVSGSGHAGPDAARQMERIHSHVQLISDISQYAYQQIPVQLNGRQGTVELYVMNKGRSGRRVKAESANILIAWDTASMGHMETLINVNKKNLRLRFGMERPELARFVESHLPELSRALGDIGYRLSDIRTELISRPVTPLTVAERVEPDQAPVGALDMRV